MKWHKEAIKILWWGPSPISQREKGSETHFQRSGMMEFFSGGKRSTTEIEKIT